MQTKTLGGFGLLGCLLSRFLVCLERIVWQGFWNTVQEAWVCESSELFFCGILPEWCGYDREQRAVSRKK